MTAIKTIVTAAFATLLVVATLATAQASETMKPLQGLSFHAGSKHAVGYYVNENGGCKLVLTRADDENFAPTRFEAAIEGGKSTRYDLAEGKALEFNCETGGRQISVNALVSTAGN